MAMVRFIEKMVVLGIEAFGRITCIMVMVYSSLEMKTSMNGSLFATKLTVMESSILIRTKKNTQVNGKMIRKMGLEKKF